jgi:arsenate reductase
MKKILVVGLNNSCRSQMVEGYLQHFAGYKAIVQSAGISPTHLHPLAVKVMLEDDIDISSHTPDLVYDHAREEFDYVLTVCDKALESCPSFRKTSKRFHRHFTISERGKEEKVLQNLRQLREEIKTYSLDFINQFVNNLS